MMFQIAENLPKWVINIQKRRIQVSFMIRLFLKLRQ